jgi:hypothetical protein
VPAYRIGGFLGLAIALIVLDSIDSRLEVKLQNGMSMSLSPRPIDQRIRRQQGASSSAAATATAAYMTRYHVQDKLLDVFQYIVALWLILPDLKDARWKVALLAAVCWRAAGAIALFATDGRRGKAWLVFFADVFKELLVVQSFAWAHQPSQLSAAALAALVGLVVVVKILLIEIPMHRQDPSQRWWVRLNRHDINERPA